MHAVTLTTVAKASTTGGTFADTLVAQGSDSTTVGTYQTGGSRVFKAWGIDSAHVAEIAWYYQRTDSTQDTTFGLRTMIPSAALGGAGTNAAFDLLGDRQQINVFTGDTPTIKVSSTASDAVVMSYLTEYDNLPGTAALFDSWQSVNSTGPPVLAINCNAVASGTVGAYGTPRAFTTDDNRWVGQRWYAILGFSAQTQVSTLAIKMFETGNLNLGCPMGSLDLDQRNFFVKLSADRNKPLIPIMNGTNAANAFLTVVDAAASTSPHVDIHCLLLPANYTPPMAT